MKIKLKYCWHLTYFNCVINTKIELKGGIPPVLRRTV